MNLAQNLMQMIYRLCHPELCILLLLCNPSLFLSYSGQGQNGGYSILHQGINKKGWWLLQECPAHAPYLLPQSSPLFIIRVQTEKLIYLHSNMLHGIGIQLGRDSQFKSFTSSL